MMMLVNQVKEQRKTSGVSEHSTLDILCIGLFNRMHLLSGQFYEVIALIIPNFQVTMAEPRELDSSLKVTELVNEMQEANFKELVWQSLL